MIHAIYEDSSDDLVKVLLEFGADPRIQDAYPYTPLRLALERGRSGIIPLLENPPTSPSQKQGTPKGPTQPNAKKMRTTTTTTASTTTTAAQQQEPPHGNGIFISCSQSESREGASLLAKYAKEKFLSARIYNDAEVEYRLEELVEHVKQSSYFIILMSDQYFRRPHTLVELHTALNTTKGRCKVVHATVDRPGAGPFDRSKVVDHIQTGRVMDYFDRKGWDVLTKYGIDLKRLEFLLEYLVNVDKPLKIGLGTASISSQKQIMDEILEGYRNEHE